MYNVEKGRGLRGDFVSISLPVTADYRIESANYITCINPMLHPNRIMEYHDFLYIIEGEWEIIENDIVYNLKSDDLLILSAGRHHYSEKPCSAGNRHMYIHAMTETGKATADVCVKEFGSLIHCQNNPKVKQLFEEIISAVWSEEELKEEMLGFLFGTLLCEVYKQQNGDGLSDKNIVAQAVAIMRAEPQNFFTCKKMAERFFVCERTLNNLFKRTYGRTFAAYQMDKKLEMVRQYLIMTPDAKLSEVAANFGFCDEFHLGKAYKKKYSVSPKRHLKM